MSVEFVAGPLDGEWHEIPPEANVRLWHEQGGQRHIYRYIGVGGGRYKYVYAGVEKPPP